MPVHPKILRWVGSLSYATPDLDALALRVPNIGFTITGNDFNTLAVVVSPESGFATEEAWYEQLRLTKWFTDTTMCRFNATNFPDIVNMPEQWSDAYVAAYRNAFLAWYHDELRPRIDPRLVYFAGDMENFAVGEPISGVTARAFDRITEIFRERRNNYAWVRAIPTASLAYANHGFLRRGCLTGYIGIEGGATIQPLANMLAIIAANEAGTTSIWMCDPVSYMQEGDLDGGEARFREYLEDVLGAGAERVILFPSVEAEDRPAQDAIIENVLTTAVGEDWGSEDHIDGYEE